jgi:monoterpene epsilon-lactone hydrolase
MLTDVSRHPYGLKALELRDRMKTGNLFYIAVAVLSCAAALAAQSSRQEPQDSATFDPDGTAHLTRVVPMPATISPEAQKWLESLTKNTSGPETLEDRRKRTDIWRAQDSAEALKYYPVKIEETTTAGVRTDIITPFTIPEANRKCVLINLHGGGFNSDSGSRIEGDPIANLAKMKVVSVYYRLAPENPFPAAVDDVVAVYKELLKTYKPQSIGIYGTSAGAILTGEVAVKLKQLELPLPAALGIFSGLADFSRPGDSRQLFTLNGFPGTMKPVDPNNLPNDDYVQKSDRKDPVLSPMFADLHGMPPTLLITSTRDILLSDTSTFHRALLRAGDDAQLIVFEALPHAFWYHFQLPETKEALELMAKFFDQKLAKSN